MPLDTEPAYDVGLAKGSPPQVTEALGQLDEQVRITGDLLAKLEERVATIVTQPIEREHDPIPIGNFQVPLATGIEQIARRARSQNEQLDGLIMRLEI